MEFVGEFEVIAKRLPRQREPCTLCPLNSPINSNSP